MSGAMANGKWQMENVKTKRVGAAAIPFSI
jgi:hypothetical protein